MNGQMSVADILKNVADWGLQDVDTLYEKLAALRLQKRGFKTLNNEETKLLKQIKTSLLSSKQMRFEYLIARRDAHDITEKEYEELLKLTQEIEKNDVVRLKRIAKLADLKHMSLPEVMQIYNIQPVQHG